MARERALTLDEHCNSVDVWDDSGRLLFGRVVDVAENGLYVDLLCAGRRRELVPYGRLFHMRSCGLLKDGVAAGDQRFPVEALLRPHPLSPWTWVSAQLELLCPEPEPSPLRICLSASPLRLLDAAGEATHPTLCGLQALGLGAGPPAAGLGGCQCADAVFRVAPPLSQLSPLALGGVAQCAEEWELRCEGRLWYGEMDERAGSRSLVEARAWRP
ncbi:uncharacterized protein LOC129599000 isoform X2 [Paramacrobiotus metropolitanus]|nr:uncharacterized protein LOC129599000 isoform X2 [Paramacrobiotus metropolitanus]XP_055353091.1 uncharacterized protein LOC129599000 isoform X2 [Paramacrobiotus metropolitanus]